MKKATLIAATLVCAYLFAAGTASAQLLKPKQAKAPAPQARAQTVKALQSHPHPFPGMGKVGPVVLVPVPYDALQSYTPPFPVVRTPVAGYSPSLAIPQPATKELLTLDANRLIRWQGWLNVDAFSVSVLNQMQKRLGTDIQLGSYTIAESAIAEAVAKTMTRNSTFKMNPNLEIDAGQVFEDDTATFYVWTYRHNYTDKGLYQLYVSVKGKMDIGEVYRTYAVPPTRVLHNDIQSLHYEFGNRGYGGIHGEWVRVIADVEIWRGVVVHVNHKGELVVAGTQNMDDWALPEVGEVPGGLRPLDDEPYVHVPVNPDPVSEWERAPSLVRNPNYVPRRATGAAFVEPLERAISIGENSFQMQAGDVQRRVNTVNPYRFRFR